MKRRDFIKKTVPVSLLPFALAGFPLRAYGRGPILDALVGAGTETDRVLVLIQLNGGNDGLNTVIPLDQYPTLSNARGNILIPENKVLRLTDQTGLHPSMTGMQSLYQSLRLAVVQSVGYPNPNLSHFRATDIWLTASDSNVTLTSGWMGRHLAEEYPDYPEGYPNAVAPDPLAIQIGSVVSVGLQGPASSMGMAITSPTSFFQLVTGGVDVAPNTPAGHELTFIRQVAQQTQQYSESIKTAAMKGANKSPLYPVSGNSLADQLKIVAQLISGGLKTRIYVVNLGGFDTHSGQVDETLGNEYGDHADLLGKLSVAITAFQDDLLRLGVENRVIGMTFSEFGRRIKSNASFGTDHGTAAPLFVFGARARSGIHGTNPIIPETVATNQNLPMLFDFRAVYASILREWFGVPNDVLQSILYQNFQGLSLIRPRQKQRYAVVGAVETQLPTEARLYENYPNPFNPSTTIRFSTMGEPVVIKVYDTLGKEVTTLVDETMARGVYEVQFDASDLPTGAYFYRIQTGAAEQVKRMLLVK